MPTTTFSSAVFEYTVPFATSLFGPENAPVAVVGWLYADGGKANKPGADPNNSGNPVVFIEALKCLVNPGDSVATPPVPYGVLQTRLDAISTTVKVDTGGAPPPTTIPEGGFPIVIGGERMQVIAIASNGWTVEARSSGVSHPKYALVMSSPLPLLTAAVVVPPYEVGKPAQVCGASGGPDADLTSTKFIDNSDAWVGAE